MYQIPRSLKAEHDGLRAAQTSRRAAVHNKGAAPGVGILGSKLRLPVVPLRLEGVERVLHHTWHWPRRGQVRVTFGAPLVLDGDDYVALARRVEDAVTALQPPRMEPPLRAPDAAA